MPMPARINHNPHLKQVHRNLSMHLAKASQQIEQLSSGRRVNRSSDDPASLALADGIHSEIRAMAEGTRNIQQSIHMLQVADGALSQINDILRRLETLTVEAASATFTDLDRRTINTEFQTLKGEIDRIAETTTFNSIPLLLKEDIFVIQAGPSETSNDVASVPIGDMRASGPTLNLEGLTLHTVKNAQGSLTRVQEAMDKVIGERNRIAAFQNRLELSVTTSESVLERMTGSESEVRDVDMAKAVSNLSRAQIMAQTAASFAVEADVDIERVLSLLK